jgi:ribosome-associated protein
MATKKKAPVKKAKAKSPRKGALKRSSGKPAGGPKARGRKPFYPAPDARKEKATSRSAPRKKPAPAAAAAPAVPRPDPSRPRALAIAKAGLDKKAENVLLIDVRGLTSYADYFVVMTAESDRQAGAVADHVDETLKKMGVEKVGVEGYEGGRWILVDYGDVVAHVMSPEAREFYDIEGLWADAPRSAIAD